MIKKNSKQKSLKREKVNRNMKPEKTQNRKEALLLVVN